MDDPHGSDSVSGRFWNSAGRWPGPSGVVSDRSKVGWNVRFELRVFPLERAQVVGIETNIIMLMKIFS